MTLYVEELPKTCDECSMRVEEDAGNGYIDCKCGIKGGHLALGNNPYARKCPLNDIKSCDKAERREINLI